MKKILAVALTLMLIPFSAFGMQILEDSTLDDVTGQAGVSIAVDVTMDVTFDTIAWGDADGIDDNDGDPTNDSGGWVGITDLDIHQMNIKLRQDYAAAGNYGDIQLFTIDVATSDNGTADATDDYTYVHMILGTQQVTFDYMSGQVELGSTNGLGEVLGDFYIDDFVLLMAPGSAVDIYAHGGAGVTIDFSFNASSIDMAALSWGDADGIGSETIDGMMYDFDSDPTNNVFTTAGYIGLSGARIETLTVNGQLLIDVASINLAAISAAGTTVEGDHDGDPTTADVPESYLLGIYAQMFGIGYDIGTTAVMLQFNGLTVHMDSFSADVVLAADNALTTGPIIGADSTTGALIYDGPGTLGSVYAAGMDVTMNGWVGIFAH